MALQRIPPDMISPQGSGSGLDADTLDGKHASSFVTTTDLTNHANNASAHHARYTDAEAVAAVKAADGHGSGIDADLLDGKEGSYYTDIPARLGYTPVNKAGDTMTGVLKVPRLQVVSSNVYACEVFILGAGSSSDKWFKIGRINTAEGSAGGGEGGYIDIELVDGRDIGSRSTSGTRLIVVARNEGITAQHLHYGNLDPASADRSHFYIYNDGSNNFWLYVKVTAYSRCYLWVHANNNGVLTPVEEAPEGTEVYNTAKAGTLPLSADGGKVWTSGNDGSGSGLDADLLDGYHASNFIRTNSSVDLTFTTAGGGIILTTPDGSKRFKVTVNNNGDLVTTQVS